MRSRIPRPANRDASEVRKISWSVPLFAGILWAVVKETPP